MLGLTRTRSVVIGLGLEGFLKRSFGCYMMFSRVIFLIVSYWFVCFSRASSLPSLRSRIRG